MPISQELQTKINKSLPEVQKYVRQLEIKNEKLETEIAKLEVENLSSEHRIAALNKALVKHNEESKLTIITNEPTVENLQAMAKHLGYTVTKN